MSGTIQPQTASPSIKHFSKPITGYTKRSAFPPTPDITPEHSRAAIGLGISFPNTNLTAAPPPPILPLSPELSPSPPSSPWHEENHEFEILAESVSISSSQLSSIPLDEEIHNYNDMEMQVATHVASTFGREGEVENDADDEWEVENTFSMNTRDYDGKPFVPRPLESLPSAIKEESEEQLRAEEGGISSSVHSNVSSSTQVGQQGNSSSNSKISDDNLVDRNNLKPSKSKSLKSRIKRILGAKGFKGAKQIKIGTAVDY